MDINGISQAMTAAYDSTKPNKEIEKKQTDTTAVFDEGAAAEFTKSEETKEKAPAKRDTATIEKLLAEAEQRTAQLRSLVEKMLLKQGQKFVSLADTFDMIKEGTLEVDDETAAEAAKEVADDGYWGVEQTSERLFSFAKALAGNDPAHADTMLEALQKGYDEAAFNTNMALSESEWKAELESQTELFNMVGDKLPAELEAQRQALIAKFN